jgi:ketosteroid isomerase-like protein
LSQFQQRSSTAMPVPSARARAGLLPSEAVHPNWGVRDTPLGMSQENVELVRKAADAWNSRGVEALLEFYPEDVIWYPFPDAPESATGFHGHDGIRDVMRGWSDSFDEYTVANDELRDCGDKVVALGEIAGLIKGSDVPVRQPMGSVAWDFRDGRIGRSRFFPSWEEALAAVGLSE